MQANDVNHFLTSLAAAIAAATGLAFDVPVAGKRALWVHQAIEDNSTPVFSVLRTYGGPSQAQYLRVPEISVQVDTRGMDAAAVLAQAWGIHEGLMNVEEHPRSAWMLPGRMIDAGGSLVEDAAGGWMVRIIKLINAPGILGRDESGRWIAPFNFDVRFERQV